MPLFSNSDREPEPKMHAGNNSSIDISRLYVFTRNIEGRQTRRAGSVNGHAWSLSLRQINSLWTSNMGSNLL